MDQITADQMEAMGLIPAGSSPALKKELHGAISPFMNIYLQSTSSPFP